MQDSCIVNIASMVNGNPFVGSCQNIVFFSIKDKEAYAWHNECIAKWNARKMILYMLVFLSKKRLLFIITIKKNHDVFRNQKSIDTQ